MRIIFITREGYKLSGARVRCYNFAEVLRRQGIEAGVFSFAEELGAKFGPQEFQMGITEKLSYGYKALKKLSRDKDSIFFIQRFNYHSLAPYLMHLIRGNKIIFDMDDWDMDENPRYYFKFWPSSKAEYLTRRVASASSACVAASRYLYDYLSKYNRRVWYLPTGVDADLFRPQLKNKKGQDKIIFSWIGTIYHSDIFENVKFIIDCFRVLRKKYKNIIFEIVGEGVYFDKLKGLVRSYNPNGSIELKSWISPEEVPGYLSSVDIGLLPLIQSSRFNLAKSPTKLFEYMASEKPVVASRMGEAANILTEARDGFLVGSKNEFVEKMEILIEDEDLRQRIGRSARETVEKNYSLNVLGQRLYEIVRTI